MNNIHACPLLDIGVKELQEAKHLACLKVKSRFLVHKRRDFLLYWYIRFWGVVLGLVVSVVCVMIIHLVILSNIISVFRSSI